jgi:putative oxidoreductase
MDGPLGPVSTISAMIMAAVKGHWGKPIWVTEGGAELPVTNIVVATALALSGPGRYSLDRLFGIRVPRWMTILFTLGSLGTVAYGLVAQPDADEATSESAEQAAA